MEFLPNEIIIEILKKLSFVDLIRCSEVSRKIFNLATDPILWSNYEFEIEYPVDILSILKLPRFRKLKHLLVSDPDHLFDKQKMKELLMILDNIDLVYLIFDNVDFKGLDPKLISKVINKTEEVTIGSETLLDEPQVKQIFMNMPNGRIKKLNVCEFSLKGIDKDVLSKAINGLVSYETQYAYISREQISEIFHQMSLETNLKKISLNVDSYIVIYGCLEIPAIVLSKALNKLEEVSISFSQLKPEQAFEFFHKMSTNTCLRSVTLAIEDGFPSTVQNIPPEVLTSAINNLEIFFAHNIHFSAVQIMVILEDAAKDSSKIKELYLELPENLPFLKLSTLGSLMPKLQNSPLKLHLQSQMIQIYDSYIGNLQQDIEAQDSLLRLKRKQNIEAQDSLLRLKKKLRRDSNALMKRIHDNVINKLKKAVKIGQLQVPRSSSSIRRYKLKKNPNQTKKTILQIRLKRCKGFFLEFFLHNNTIVGNVKS